MNEDVVEMQEGEVIGMPLNDKDFEKKEVPWEKKSRNLSYQNLARLKAKGMTYKMIAEHVGTTEQVVKNVFYEERKRKKNTKRGRPKGSQNRKTIARNMLISEAQREEVFNALKPENAGRATAAMGHVMQCMQIGQNVDVESIDSLYMALSAYVECCYKSDFPTTLANCLLAVGVSRDMIFQWKRGITRQDEPEYKKFAESVYFVVQAGIEACMASGLMNPVTGIWWEKSHFGMSETQAAIAADINPLGDRKSAQQIAEEYEGVDLP